MASMCFSSTTTVRPIEPKISFANATSSSVACFPRASAIMPWRMRQGVFGMARTTRAGCPSSRSMSPVVTLAAAEMMSASLRSSFFTSCRNPFTCCGLRQIKTRSAPETAWALLV